MSSLEKNALEICLIAAVAKNGVIGNNNRLPWHLPEDLRHFKALTLGHTVVMGRRTYESLPKRLPDRRMVVLSSKLDPLDPQHSGVEIYGSWSVARAQIEPTSKVFIIGGAELYRTALMFADSIELTEIQQDFNGDVRFPEFPLSPTTWLETQRTQAKSPSGFDYAFVTYRRRYHCQ